MLRRAGSTVVMPRAASVLCYEHRANTRADHWIPTICIQFFSEIQIENRASYDPIPSFSYKTLYIHFQNKVT